MFIETRSNNCIVKPLEYVNLNRYQIKPQSTISFNSKTHRKEEKRKTKWSKRTEQNKLKPFISRAIEKIENILNHLRTENEWTRSTTSRRPSCPTTDVCAATFTRFKTRMGGYSVARVRRSLMLDNQPSSWIIDNNCDVAVGSYVLPSGVRPPIATDKSLFFVSSSYLL